ncbi:hypothetical protein BCR26_04080 [Enterococcus rivorum]|uniref:Uncharacterized protein n=2 Tax=Enterococcus rivorum TaxID=762845 RepID=A0A1E5KU95_9ENTE|nr:hypothetical protein BCR26_04080 [Enterococcus rivorum]
MQKNSHILKGNKRAHMKRKSVVLFRLVLLILGIVATYTYVRVSKENEVEAIILDKDGKQIEPVESSLENVGD